jgi:hypothetical protein
VLTTPFPDVILNGQEKIPLTLACVHFCVQGL